jgi:hypothetical protein
LTDRQAAWFCALGEPLAAAELDEISAYLRGLGSNPALAVRPAKEWSEAGRRCRSPAPAWWQAEEAERERLERIAQPQRDDAEWLTLCERIHGAAALAAARSGCTDAGLIHAAAGSAIFAAHHERLARSAGMDEGHPFLRKYALYCGGRWPLGIYEDGFGIF